MQRVHFCSGMVFTTGGSISAAVLRYVQAIATVGGSDVLTVPAAGAAGGVGTVTLLVNRASQISAESVEWDGAELRDDAFVARLHERTSELLAPAVWNDPDPLDLGSGSGSESGSGARSVR